MVVDESNDVGNEVKMVLLTLQWGCRLRATERGESSAGGDELEGEQEDGAPRFGSVEPHASISGSVQTSGLGTKKFLSIGAYDVLASWDNLLHRNSRPCFCRAATRRATSCFLKHCCPRSCHWRLLMVDMSDSNVMAL